MSDWHRRRMYGDMNHRPGTGRVASAAGHFAGAMTYEFQDRRQPYKQYEANMKKDGDIRIAAAVFNASGPTFREIGKALGWHQGPVNGTSKRRQSPAKPVPYLENIGGLYPNNMIFISGIPFQNASKFSVYLQRGDSLDPRQIAMAFDVRFKWGNPVSQNCVVLNHKEGHWDDKLEQRNTPYFPFKRGTEFEMIILVEDRCFKIAVNNKHFTEFNHRVDPGRIDKLRIEGDVKVTKILFQE